MRKRDAKIGTRVRTNMGIQQTGFIVPLVPRDKWTDGTYRYPETARETREWVGVRWDNGTQGLSSIVHLEPIPVITCPDCKRPVWDTAFASKLNKCWNCGLAFDSPERN